MVKTLKQIGNSYGVIIETTDGEKSERDLPACHEGNDRTPCWKIEPAPECSNGVLVVCRDTACLQTKVPANTVNRLYYRQR